MKQTTKVLYAILMVAMILFFSVNKSISQVTDIDSNEYKTVIIGNQEWMAENLNVEHYRNGDVIPQVQDENQWKNLTTGAWCYYENNSENGKTYGKLYNWYALNDPRGLAPVGWHIPSDVEWTMLTDYLGGEKIADKKMKSTNGWFDKGNGTNSSGFSANSGGSRHEKGYFENIVRYSFFWSSSEDGNGSVWSRFLYCYTPSVYRLVYLKNYGFSVRCVKDH